MSGTRAVRMQSTTTNSTRSPNQPVHLMSVSPQPSGYAAHAGRATADFDRNCSDDWFDSVERRNTRCPDCGGDANATRYCPNTGVLHVDRLVGPNATKQDPKVAVANIALFNGVRTNRTVIDAIADQLECTNVSNGQVLFRAGDVGSCMYVMLSGSVELRGADNRVIATITQGKQFGEIAMLYGGTRTATAVVTNYGTVGKLDKRALESVIQRHHCTEDIMKNAQNIPYVKQWFVNTVPLFQTCRSNALFIDAIAENLCYRSYNVGSQIIKEGDVGTEMYFIVCGSADVIVGGRKVSTLNQGQYCGEIAMLYGGARTATVKCTSYTHCYVLTKALFDSVLDRFTDCIDIIYGQAQETRYLKEHFIKKLPLFSAMKNNAEFVLNIADALHSVSFRPGEYIVREGASGTEMYFIARGDAVVEKNDREVARISSGDFFGEVSLIYDEPRSASIRAVHYVHSYALQQDAFEVIAVAFPTWWESITKQGQLLARVDRSRQSTSTQNHGLVIPNVDRGTPAALMGHVPHTTQQLMQAEQGSAEQRDMLRRQLREQGQQRPRETTAQERLQAMIDERNCIVCTDKEKCMLAIPCGHVSCCEECASKVGNQCPLCRKAVSQMIKAHF